MRFVLDGMNVEVESMSFSDLTWLLDEHADIVPVMNSTRTTPHISALVNDELRVVCTREQLICYDLRKPERFMRFSFAEEKWSVSDVTSLVDIYVAEVPLRKINAIKCIRSFTGMGLKESKDLVELTAPDRIVRLGVPKADAILFRDNYIAEADGRLELRPAGSKAIIPELLEDDLEEESFPYPQGWDPVFWPVVGHLRTLLESFFKMEVPC